MTKRRETIYTPRSTVCAIWRYHWPGQFGASTSIGKNYSVVRICVYVYMYTYLYNDNMENEHESNHEQGNQSLDTVDISHICINKYQ